jgi:hypothetical protein
MRNKMSVEDDEKELRLRDQFAIAAMQALITKEGTYSNFIDNEMWGEDYQKRAKARQERIAMVAYKMADEMRKARLQVFK